MVEIIMFKSDVGLMPADQDAITAMHNIPQGSHVTVKVSVPRNIRQHNLFFALLNVVFQAQREPRQFPTKEKMLDAIKMATGHIREVRDIHGKTHFVPDSIAIGRLDGIAFKEWMDSAIRVILDHILPGVSQRDLEQQIADMLRIPGPEQSER